MASTLNLLEGGARSVNRVVNPSPCVSHLGIYEVMNVRIFGYHTHLTCICVAGSICLANHYSNLERSQSIAQFVPVVSFRVTGIERVVPSFENNEGELT